MNDFSMRVKSDSLPRMSSLNIEVDFALMMGTDCVLVVRIFLSSSADGYSKEGGERKCKINWQHPVPL